MADLEHVKMITRQGVATWNAWRRDNPMIRADLRDFLSPIISMG
jgi:hypothetical protein